MTSTFKTLLERERALATLEDEVARMYKSLAWPARLRTYMHALSTSKLEYNYDVIRGKFTTSGAHDVIAIRLHHHRRMKNDLCTEQLTR